MKTLLGVFVALIIIIGGVYYFTKETKTVDQNEVVMEGNSTSTGAFPEVDEPVSTSTPIEKEERKDVEAIGMSVENNPITAYHFGTGDTEILFIGGIHGGYEWNTALLGYDVVDYFKANPSVIPSNVTVTVIPVMNPDGLKKVAGTVSRFEPSVIKGETSVGRFNANNVDLNRNFDCDWKSEGVWQNKTVSGGDSAFSEPESQAIRDYVDSHSIKAAVVWYSAAGGVFASNCHKEVLPETKALMNTYAKASGYKAYESFNFYEITGDMVNWFAKKDIPAVSVLLTNHTSTEWDKNKAGIDAILATYKQ